jgi:hypothetical protein
MSCIFGKRLLFNIEFLPAIDEPVTAIDMIPAIPRNLDGRSIEQGMQK